jgi:hypothetical protein
VASWYLLFLGAIDPFHSVKKAIGDESPMTFLRDTFAGTKGRRDGILF